ncbi:MAG: hypothetical protein ACYS9C_07840 [Planctomycetota bacterium]
MDKYIGFDINCKKTVVYIVRLRGRQSARDNWGLSGLPKVLKV